METRKEKKVIFRKKKKEWNFPGKKKTVLYFYAQLFKVDSCEKSTLFHSANRFARFLRFFVDLDM